MLDNGWVVWGLGLGALFAVDGLLVAAGRPSLSSHARSHPILTAAGLTVLTVHLRPRSAP